MGKSFYVAFKTGPRKVEIFHVVNLKVKHHHTSEINAKGVETCDCLHHRMREAGGAPCKHLEFLKSGIKFVVAHGKSWEPIGDRSLEEGKVGIYDFEQSKMGVLSETMPDVGLGQILMEMDPDRAEPFKGTSGRLNAKRLFLECLKSHDSALTLIDPSVKAAGEAHGTAKIDLPEKEPEPLKETFDPSVKGTEAAPEAGPTEDRTAWKKIARPDPRLFYVENDVWDAIVCSIHNGQNILLTGPSGCGKSELVHLAAKSADIPFEPFNMGAMSEPRLSLIGATHFSKDKGTWFGESRFVRTVKKDRAVILLDELTRSVPAAYNILLPLMDRQGYLALDESEDAAVIHKGKRTAFCATANIGMEYTGTEEMDKAMNDRFQVVIDLFFPPEAQEAQIIKHRTKLDDVNIKKLVQLGVKQREMTKDGEFTGYISTRMLLSAAQFVVDGMSLANGIKFGIENHFSSDGGDASERTKIRQIFQKSGGR